MQRRRPAPPPDRPGRDSRPDGPATPTRPKVVPLRAVVSGSSIVTSGVPVDLQIPVDALRVMKSDLEAYYWDRVGEDGGRPGERDQIAFCIRQVADHAAALESIALQKGGARLLVSALPEAEALALAHAALPGTHWVHEGDPIEEVFAKVSDLLGLANRVGVRASAGRPQRT